MSCHRLRVSESLGISKTTVSKYVRIGFEGEEFNTPGKIRKHKRPKRCIDSFTKCALRNVIYEFHRNSMYCNWNYYACSCIVCFTHYLTFFLTKCYASCIILYHQQFTVNPYIQVWFKLSRKYFYGLPMSFCEAFVISNAGKPNCTS